MFATKSWCLLFIFVTFTTKCAATYDLEVVDESLGYKVGTTKLRLMTSDYSHKKLRRSAQLTHNFPSALSFSFKMGQDDVLLNLRKNEYMDPSPPFYVVRQGKIVRENKQELTNDYAYYQDKEIGAAVMVGVQDRGAHYFVTGNYFYAGEEYTIRPIKSNENKDIDHVVYKLNEDSLEINKGINNSTAKHLNRAIQTNLSSLLTITKVYNSSHIAKRSSQVYRNVDRDAIMHQDYIDLMPSTLNEYDKSQNSTESTKPSYSLTSDGQGRVKRQAKVYIVELLVIIDYNVYEVWLNGVMVNQEGNKRNEALRRIKQFYSFILNGVDLRYKSVQRSGDFVIGVTWAGIIVFDRPVPELWTNSTSQPMNSRDLVESSAALEAFRRWSEGQGEHLPPSDHVMLFTGHNLTYGGSVSNAGLAYLGSVCNPEYYFSIVEEYFEFRDVAIAAHELGHSLGARHDMDGNTCLTFDRYIMTSRFQFPTIRKAQNPWLFSPCSIDYFRSFIDALNRNDTNCLVTRESKTDNKEIQPFLSSLPGEVYAGDDFCRIGDGPLSYICRDHHMQEYSSICFAGIFCYSPTQRQCVPKLPPDGYCCGDKKWCLNGSCQFSELAPATKGDDCPFGDDPGLFEGKACPEIVKSSKAQCYRDTFRSRCCESCHSVKLPMSGCEYGDMINFCDAEKCNSYDPDYAQENCCETCNFTSLTWPTSISQGITALQGEIIHETKAPHNMRHTTQQTNVGNNTMEENFNNEENDSSGSTLSYETLKNNNNAYKSNVLQTVTSKWLELLKKRKGNPTSHSRDHRRGFNAIQHLRLLWYILNIVRHQRQDKNYENNMALLRKSNSEHIYDKHQENSPTTLIYNVYLVDNAVISNLTGKGWDRKSSQHKDDDDNSDEMD